MINAFIVPALIALIIKGYVLSVSTRDKGRSIIFISLCYCFFAQNIAECAGFIQHQSGDSAGFIVRAYLTASVCGLALICVYALAITHSKTYKSFAKILGAVSFMLIMIIWLTDLIAVGAVSINYTYAVDRGELYWSYHVFAGSCFLITSLNLLLGIFRSNNPITVVQCGYTLAGILPIALAGFGVMAAMASGYQVNAVGIMPIATTLFLLLTLRSEDKHNLTDIRKYLPYSRERIMTNEMMDLISSYSLGQIDYKEYKKGTEKLAVKYQLSRTNGNVSNAAKLMKVDRTTVAHMVKRHGLKDSQE